MTQLVYMVILDFIESNQEQFAEFCGDDSIAWANHNEFKEWLEERDKSDAKILYELKANNERLEKEADWLAKQLTKFEVIPCPEHPCSRSGKNVCLQCWREAARNALEQCKS